MDIRKFTERGSAMTKPLTKPSPPAGTIFDDVYRTMVQKMAILLIPVINEVFGTSYDERTAVEQLRNEHLEMAGRIITDSIIRLGDTLYHLECQSTPDGTMAIRMFEYDFAIALDEARKADVPGILTFPLSAVIYLRHSDATPDRLSLQVVFPDGQAATYSVPVIKVQGYSLEEIFRKNLWLFIPFYIMRYEKQFAAMEHDAAKREAMLADLRRMAKMLENRMDDEAHGNISMDILRLAKKIADHLLRKQQDTKQEVSSIMGGKILELHSEKMLRLGKAEGRAEGMKAGKAEGENRLSRLISLLLKGGKTDEIAAATESEDARNELYAKYGIA